MKKGRDKTDNGHIFPFGPDINIKKCYNEK